MKASQRSQTLIDGPAEAKSTLGFGHWMRRVMAECDRAKDELSADGVHDLRVALRRCRSMADGLMVIDPIPSWREMKRAGGRLFRGLGLLRDAQVMSEWVRQLRPEGDSESSVLLNRLAEQESQHKRLAAEVVREFDIKQWKKWSGELPPRAARVRLGGLVFQHLALERWTEAHYLHRQAIRNRSQISFHRLRIGIKRFRYIVESFLPQQHEAWNLDLKDLQDLLGDIHDLDVLSATARRMNAFSIPESRARWRAMIQTKRDQRIAGYRERMVGSKSLWSAWRVALPHGDQIQAAAMTRLRLWASFLDPDIGHSQHVAALARQVFDGLARLGLAQADNHSNARTILLTAAFLHEVGLAKHSKGHHKTSFCMIKKLRPPLSWSQEDLLMLAFVVRFHRGALPHTQHQTLRLLTPQQRQILRLLAGILRLADAFDDARDGHVRRLKVEDKYGFLLVSAAGFLPVTRTGQNVAAARHLLEVVLRKPILVKSLNEPRDHPKASTQITQHQT